MMPQRPLLCAIRTRSSGYSPTTAEDDRPCPQDKEEDALGGGHMLKPKAVNDNSRLETSIDKPGLERPMETGPSIGDTQYMKNM